MAVWHSCAPNAIREKTANRPEGSFITKANRQFVLKLTTMVRHERRRRNV